MDDYLAPLAGGMCIGGAAALLLVANGRVAGISGIFGRTLGAGRRWSDAAFVLGLVAGPFLHAAVFGRLPAVTIATSWPLVIAAGLLVGFGSRMGSGCTSGHGVVGLARLSRRSMAATATFLAAGVVAASLGSLIR